MHKDEEGRLVADKEDWEKALKESNERLTRFLAEPVNAANTKVLRAEMFANGLLRDKLIVGAEGRVVKDGFGEYYIVSEEEAEGQVSFFEDNADTSDE